MEFYTLEFWNETCLFFRAEMERGLSRKHIIEGKVWEGAQQSCLKVSPSHACMHLFNIYSTINI